MTAKIRPPDGPWSLAWAKSPDDDGAWLPLWRHMADSAEVANRLWMEWMPPASREVVAAETGSQILAGSLAVFLAAAHDVGKISEEFASQNVELRERMSRVGFAIPNAAVSSGQRRERPHGSVSARSLWEWLFEAIGGRGKASTISAVLAGHHGTFPPGPPQELPESDAIWAESRRSAIDFAVGLSEITEADLVQVATVGLSQAAQVVLAGFVVVCDWIASNTELFPYGTDGEDGDRAARGLAALALPRPWSPSPPLDDAALFADRFELPKGASPRPVQLAAVEQARLMIEPELMLIEAPTGEGKTEAAFAAAEVIAAKFGCGGLTVALPTCATSDAMFSRTLSWLDRSVPAGTVASALLTHSRARFNDEFTGLSAVVPDRGLAGIHDDSPSGAGSLTAHWWLRARKKSALADFTVGTIDQVLLLALQSRHLMLRHLGIVGKVVVLDEVHAADSYMSHFLDRALEWLGAERVPVVALTATLTPERRCAMLAAYRRGRSAAVGEQIVAGSRPGPDFEATAAATAFPLIVRVGSGLPTLTEPAASGRETAYRMEFVGDDDAELVQSVSDAVNSGVCVVVVRNTVARAQEVYTALLNELGSSRTMLMHSRFILADRLHREGQVKELLGPPAIGRRRPPGMVIVSTQVIESSLDIDADLMYSDLAPIDLILQRAGRLHRHDRPAGTRPGIAATPRFLISGVELSSDGSSPTVDKGSSYVYGGASLLRTTAVLRDHLERTEGIVESPRDVADLVRAAYSPDAVPPAGWEDDWRSAEKRQQESDAERERRSGAFLLRSPGPGPAYGWNSGSSDEPREEVLGHAQVRDAENSLDVVVVREVDGRVRSLPWLERRGDELVDSDLGVDDELARAVAMCTVSLPAWTFRGKREAWLIEELETRGIPGWQKSPWLKGMLPLPLNEDLWVRIGDLHMEYDRSTGLTVRVKGDA